jgi:hypothetical protein
VRAQQPGCGAATTWSRGCCQTPCCRTRGMCCPRSSALGDGSTPRAPCRLDGTRCTHRAREHRTSPAAACLAACGEIEWYAACVFCQTGVHDWSEHVTLLFILKSPLPRSRAAVQRGISVRHTNTGDYALLTASLQTRKRAVFPCLSLSRRVAVAVEQEDRDTCERRSGHHA